MPNVDRKLIFQKEERALSFDGINIKECMEETIQFDDPVLDEILMQEELMRDIVFGKNIFEKFYIIGADKSEMRKVQLQLADNNETPE